MGQYNFQSKLIWCNKTRLLSATLKSNFSSTTRFGAESINLQTLLHNSNSLKLKPICAHGMINQWKLSTVIGNCFALQVAFQFKFYGSNDIVISAWRMFNLRFPGFRLLSTKKEKGRNVILTIGSEKSKTINVNCVSFCLFIQQT